MKSIFFTLIMLILSNNLIAQKNIWLGIDAGIDYDHFEISDPGGYISERPIVAGHIGINAEKELNKTFSAGFGLIFKTYMEGINYKDGSIRSNDRAFNSLMAPVYFNAGKSINRSLFKLLATAGGNFVYNFDYWTDGPNDWFGSSAYTNNNGQAFSEDFYGTANLKRVFFLLHAGGGIEFAIFKECRFRVMAKRHFGFTNVIETTSDYTINGTSLPTASLNSKGGFTTTSLQFFYPLYKKNNFGD